MVLKYNLDRLIAGLGFHRSWYFWNYLKLHGIDSVDALPPSEQKFFLTLLLTALPFVAMGIWSD